MERSCDSRWREFHPSSRQGRFIVSGNMGQGGSSVVSLLVEQDRRFTRSSLHIPGDQAVDQNGQISDAAAEVGHYLFEPHVDFLLV